MRVKFLPRKTFQSLVLIASFLLGVYLTFSIHLSPGASPAPQLSDHVIVESFPYKNHLPWQIQRHPQTQGIGFQPRNQFQRLQEIWMDQPGLHFEARTTAAYHSQSIDFATLPWAIGTRPFHFSTTVVIDRGNQQNWFEPGLGISLATASPEQMGDNDFAITFALQQAGVTPAVRQGKVFQLDPNDTHHLADTVLSPFIPPIDHRIHALDWPQLWLANTTLQLEVTRSPDSALDFAIFDLSPNNPNPLWWSGRYQLPASFAAQPLQFITLQRIPVTAGHVGYPNFQLTGRVTALQAYALDTAPPPQITDYQAHNAVLGPGNSITVQGDNFLPELQAWIGDRPAPCTWISPTQVRLQLPQHPAGRYPLILVNPNGLRATLNPGIAYGQLLEGAEPYEVSPQGGDRVQLIGAGFEAQTQVWIGQNLAKIVDYQDPSHLWIEVPPGEIGIQGIKVQSSGQFSHVFQGQAQITYAPHPYLLGDQAFLDATQSRLRQPEWSAYQQVIHNASQEALGAPLPETSESNDASRLEALTWAYAWTGQSIYLDRLREWLAFKWQETDTGEFHAMTVAAMAIAYDVLFQHWSPSERQHFLTYLDRALTTYIQDREAKLWFLGSDGKLQVNGSNTVAVGNAGGGLAALALQYSHPHPAQQAINEAIGQEQYFAEYSLTPDGGAVEGSLYWNYGLGYYLLFAHALAASTGNDCGLLNHPHLLQTSHYVETTFSADGTFLTFNDTQPFFTGGPILADLGNRLDHPLLLWLADYGIGLRSGENPNQIHVNLGSPFWMFLWRGEAPASPNFPGIPTLSTLDNLQLGVLRSDNSATPQLLVGVKGQAGNITHHIQPDVGSFILQIDGETLILDPGYYQPSSTAHSLLLLNNTGPQVSGGVIVESQEAGDWRMVTIDVTQAYAKSHPLNQQEISKLSLQSVEENHLSCPASVRRVFVLSGDEAVVILDEVLMPQRPNGKVHTLLQTNGKPDSLNVSEQTWSVKGAKASMGVRIFPPPESKLDFDQVQRDFEESWLFNRLARAGRINWHTLRLSYSPQASAPAVMVLTNPSVLDPKQISLSRAAKTIQVKAGSKTLAQFAWIDGHWQAQQP